MLADRRSDAYVNPDDWGILRTLAIYRLILIGLLAVFYLSGYGPYLFEESVPRAVPRLIIAYLLPGLLLLAATISRVPALNLQAHLAFLVDALAIIALMYVARGVSSGLGVLMITPAVGCSLILPLRRGLLNAALGTFALFGAEALHQPWPAINAAELTTTGLLGLMLFATAIGAGVVAARARRSEAQAVRFGSDLASLSRLNERIVETMDTAVIVLDEDRRLRLTNAAAKRLLRVGADDDGKPVAEFLPGLNGALRAWEQNPNHPREPLYLYTDGTEVLPRFTRLGYSQWAPVLVLLEDATRVREQAQQLKLAALGRLSAGIAHEIRNPLSAIKHAGQLLAESPHLAEEDLRLLGMVQRHSVRIDKIIGDVLRLSRRDPASPQSLALRDFIGRSIEIYRESNPDAARPIDFNDVSESLRVRFDPNQLQQILHNLWSNSFDHGARSGLAVRITLQGGV